MSYWVSLHETNDPESPIVEVDPHQEGGTYAIGGSNEADLNITYNYSEVYHLFQFSIKDLDGQKAETMISKLRELVLKLGTKKYERDYWAPTPGNAGAALETLLDWAIRHPNAYFKVG